MPKRSGFVTLPGDAAQPLMKYFLSERAWGKLVFLGCVQLGRTMEPIRENCAGGGCSLEKMAEEIFLLTVESWRNQVASKQEGGIDLSESQYLTLDALYNATGPLHVGEIQRGIGVLPAQMSRIIRSLESGFERPLIRCELNQADKRKIDVRITPEGKQQFEDFRGQKLKRTVKVLDKLSEQDRRDFVRVCGKIRELHRSTREERK